MKQDFEKALELISNICLDDFQKKINKVKKINIQKTIEQL